MLRGGEHVARARDVDGLGAVPGGGRALERPDDGRGVEDGQREGAAAAAGGGAGPGLGEGGGGGGRVGDVCMDEVDAFAEQVRARRGHEVYDADGCGGLPALQELLDYIAAYEACVMVLAGGLLGSGYNSVLNRGGLVALVLLPEWRHLPDPPTTIYLRSSFGGETFS